MLKLRDRQYILAPFRNFSAVMGYFVVSAVLICALFEAAAFALWSVWGALRPNLVENLMAESPAYDRYSWAHDFWKEEKERWDKEKAEYVPFRIWGVGLWQGKYVNNDDTEMGIIRRTINPADTKSEAGPVLNVWVLGGSTVYGLGVPDWATLPSYLSGKLNADLPECVKVTNLGVQGYVISQETILLIDELKAGHHPDEVVFYDGLNDAYVGGVSPGIPTVHLEFDQIKARVENTTKAKLSFLNHTYSLKTVRAVLRHLRKPATVRVSPEALAGRARATLRNYEANLAVVRALAAAYHFDVYFFWQPCLFYGSKPLVPFERTVIQITKKAVSGDIEEGMVAVYQEAERRSAASGSFTFLGGVFDGVSEPLYVGDVLHLAPRGNEIVAESIARTLEAALQASHKRGCDPHAIR